MSQKTSQVLKFMSAPISFFGNNFSVFGPTLKIFDLKGYFLNTDYLQIYNLNKNWTRTRSS